jgi:hypothetical protein
VNMVSIPLLHVRAEVVSLEMNFCPLNCFDVKDQHVPLSVGRDVGMSPERRNSLRLIEVLKSSLVN